MTESTRWYKGNLHMHSFWSDGKGFPEIIACWFKDQGYHFIAFTEHDRLQEGHCWISTDPRADPGSTIARDGLLQEYVQALDDGWVQRRAGKEAEEIRLRPLAEYRQRFEQPERFLIMTGEEISARWGEGPFGQVHWINACNLETAIAPPPTQPSSTKAIRATVEAGEATARHSKRPVLISLNHPNFEWNATAEDIAAVKDLRFMEIHTALNTCNNLGDDLHCGVERIWDVALTLRLGELHGPPIYGLVTDDCHAYRPGHPVLGDWALPGRAWVMVRAAALDASSIISGMDGGDFYGSSGVTLVDVGRDSNGMGLEIEPERGRRYRTRFIGTRRGYDPRRDPVVDDDGGEIRTTARYSDDIGRVLAERNDLVPTYAFRGDELYVRAVVTSDVDHPNPSYPGQKTQAWTQPVVP